MTPDMPNAGPNRSLSCMGAPGALGEGGMLRADFEKPSEEMTNPRAILQMPPPHPARFRPARFRWPLLTSLLAHGVVLAVVAILFYATPRVASDGGAVAQVDFREALAMAAAPEPLRTELEPLDRSVMDPLPRFVPPEAPLPLPEDLPEIEQRTSVDVLPELQITARMFRRERPQPESAPEAAPPPTARAAPPAAAPPRPGKLRLVYRPNTEDYYPLEAARRRIEGRALVEMVVDATGLVVRARVVRSSGNELLDRAALKLVRVIRFVPPGAVVRTRQSVNFTMDGRS